MCCYVLVLQAKLIYSFVWTVFPTTHTKEKMSLAHETSYVCCSYDLLTS